MPHVLKLFYLLNPYTNILCVINCLSDVSKHPETGDDLFGISCALVMSLIVNQSTLLNKAQMRKGKKVVSVVNV